MTYQPTTTLAERRASCAAAQQALFARDPEAKARHDEAVASINGIFAPYGGPEAYSDYRRRCEALDARWFANMAAAIERGQVLVLTGDL
jgi:hypothetical protein